MARADEERDALGFTPNNIPAAPTGEPSTYGQQMRKVGGFMVDAAGTALKTVVGAPGYGINRLTAAAPAEPTPTVNAPPTPATITRAQDSQAANGLGAPPGAPTSAPGATTTSTQVTGTPTGITKTVSPSGAVTYGNVGFDPGFEARGQVSPQNMGAADALAAKSRGESLALIARSQPQPAPAQAVVLDAAPLGFKPQPSSGSGPNYAGLSANQRAGLEQRSAEVAASNATTLATNAASNATQRYGFDTQAATSAARLGLDATRAGADIAHTKASTGEITQRTELAQQIASARAAHAKALASGDAKAIETAEANLRALQGKWEKEAPELFSTSVVPGGVDPATGMPAPASAIVTNKRSGETRVISPQEARGGTAAAKYEVGKVYKDANGTKAKWDGSKFVPV